MHIYNRFVSFRSKSGPVAIVTFFLTHPVFVVKNGFYVIGHNYRGELFHGTNGSPT